MPALGMAAAETLAYEYKIKAAYLYNFTKFTKWPLQATEAREGATFNICMFGQNPFGQDIDNFKGKLTSGVPVAITTVADVSQLGQCHLLYINQSEKNNLRTVLQALEGQPVLTVSDINGFVNDGGCIELLSQGGKVFFNINLQATQKAQLKMSAQLLELAKVVVNK